MIQTVLGTIDSSLIRNTLSHEHITFGKIGHIDDKDNNYQRETAFQNALEKSAMIQAYDVNFVVDATPIEWGRDSELLTRVSKETGIHIACATGFYKDGDELQFLKSMSYYESVTKYCTRLFLRELTEGIASTAVKPSFIKVASSYGEIRPVERDIIKAACAVQRVLHVPILTHCDRGTMAPEQVRMFQEEQADCSRIIIGHMTNNRNLAELEEIMNKGFLIGMDQFGILSIPDIPDNEEKMENLLTLLKKGYADHIVLSHDLMFDRMGTVSKSKPRYPDMIYKTVLPYLREHGISEEDIKKITRENLVRVFEKE